MTANLAQRVEQVRRDVLRRVLADGVAAAQRTLIAEIIIGELLDRIGAALDRGETATLESWLEVTYERHGALPYLSAILESTCVTLMEVGRADGWLGGVDAMRSVASTVAHAIHRPRLQPMEISGESIDEIDVVINDLIARLFEKDALTGEHSRAVSMWCVRLARKLGLGSDEQLLVQRGGLLHDIGKIATPSDILNAPRRLTDDERLIIERHPLEGVEIMIDIPELAELIPMARSHHERLDGKGYPDGLEGDEISVAVRIVTVADCFNAMIGRRPYRPPLPPSFALEELSRYSGSHFDPELVSAMEQVVSDHERV
jgi:putative nucleotidyltransferase with HDIG domain